MLILPDVKGRFYEVREERNTSSKLWPTASNEGLRVPPKDSGEKGIDLLTKAEVGLIMLRFLLCVEGEKRWFPENGLDIEVLGRVLGTL